MKLATFLILSFLLGIVKIALIPLVFPIAIVLRAGGAPGFVDWWFDVGGEMLDGLLD